MLNFQAKNEPTKVCLWSVCWEIFGISGPQQRDKRGSSQGNGNINHEPPAIVKGLKSFLGKVSYIRRFVPGLASITSAFTKLLKKGQEFEWGET